MRYAETEVKNHKDFFPRRRLPTQVQFALIFTCFFSLIMLIYHVTSTSFGFFFLALLLVLCIAGTVTFSVQRSRDLMLATEFQNAIFTSALGVESIFYLILRKDGTITYIDEGLKHIFPLFSRLHYRTLASFLEMGRVSKEDSEQIFAAIEKDEPQKVIITIRDGEGDARTIVITTDRISRPSHFILIRARDYVAKRTEAASQAEPSSQSASTLAQKLYDQLPFGFVLANADGKIVYANFTLEHWLGLGRGQLPEHQVALHDIILPATEKSGGAAQGNAKLSDVRLLHSAGHSVDVTMLQEAEYDAQGKVAGYAMVFYPRQPIAAYPATGANDNASSDDCWQLISASPIPTVHMRDDGKILSVNAAFHALTHNTLANGIPETLLDLVSPEKRAETQALFARIIAGEALPLPQLIELGLPGGQQVTISMYVSRIGGLAMNGSEGHDFILYLIDVTEQKNLELRFSHSQKMQAVGQLAGGVAHDFNNLLTAMIGFCDLLLMRHPAGDQSFADIMQIKQNANRAANLVRQLLAFSRRQTLQPKTLDITDVLAELSNLVRRLIGENIELKMIHGRDVGMVKADQGQLEQVIINLAVNARDAMSKGGVLTIQTSAAVISSRHSLPADLIAPAEEDNIIPPGNYVLVEVSDTGCGIPKEIIQKIFEPFFSTKEVGSGTGLGLSTVYGIIKQTGGYVYVSSREGKGTTFYIYFPSHQSKGIAPAAESEAVEKIAADLTGRGTILLVEDETPVRIFSARALRNKGYTVLEADCAETALEIMNTQGSEVELIITDVIMPGMNGPTMVEKINEQYPNIKVIFISGYAEDVFMHSYGSERSFNFLAKPFTLKQLAGKVKEVASGK